MVSLGSMFKDTSADEPERPELKSRRLKVARSEQAFHRSWPGWRPKHGIDLSLVSGTGLRGRITRKDVLNAVREGAAKSASSSEAAGDAGDQAVFSRLRRS